MKFGKTAIGLLIFSVFLGGVASSAKTCLDRNPFLLQLSVATPVKVGIHEEVRTGQFKHCGNEWWKFGSCCDEEDLLIAYKLEADLIDSTQNKLVEFLNLMQKEMIQSFSRKIASTTKDKVEEYKLKMKSFFSSSVLSNFKADSKVCWNYMKKVRGSALCTTCSGRSEESFKNGKILISPDTCETAVNNCERFFTGLTTLVDSLKRVYEASEAVKSEDEEFLKMKLSYKRHLRWIELYRPPQDLLEGFLNYYEQKKAGNKNAFLLAGKVCSMIMNVNKKPYILVLDEDSIHKIANAERSMEISDFNDARDKLTLANKQNNTDLEKEKDTALKKEAIRHNAALEDIRKKKLDRIQNAKAIQDENKLFKKNIENNEKSYKEKKDQIQKAFTSAIDELVKHLRNDIGKLEAKSKSQLSNWIKQKSLVNQADRQLNLDQQVNWDFGLIQVFTADSSVLVLANGKAFNDLMVTPHPGIIVEGSGSPFRPMNMTLAFP